VIKLNFPRRLFVTLLVIYTCQEALAFVSPTSNENCSSFIDVARFEELESLNQNDRELTAIDWSPTSIVLAALYVSDTGLTLLDYTIQIINVANGEIVAQLHQQAYGIPDIAWSPDSSRLAYITWNGYEPDQLKIWDIEAKNAFPVEIETDTASDIIWSPDGDQIATIGRDVQIWDAASERLVEEFDSHSIMLVYGSIWNSSGLRWVSRSDNHIKNVWQAGADEPLFTLGNEYPDNAMLSPSGTLVTVGYDITWLWSVNEKQLLDSLEIYGFPLAWSPDETCIVTVTNETQLNDSSRFINVWDVATGQSLAVIEVHTTEDINNLAWSPDGTMLASTSDDDTLRIWGVPTAETVIN